jgi:hypothetical protein
MSDFLAPVNWRALMPPRPEPVRKREQVEQPVTSMKRVEAPPKETNNMTYDEQELCLKAERLIAEGDLDAATAAVRQFERVVKARHKVTVEHDDGDPDDWSEEATAPDGDGEDDSSDDSEDDEENDNVPMRAKKGFQQNYNLMDRGHANMATPRSSAHKPAYTGTSTTSATTAPRRHKFDALVEKTMRENGGMSKTGAMQLCRRLYPEIFRDYNSSSAQIQQSARSGVNEYAKRAPVTFESLCEEEIRKGCTTLVQAQQRVIQMYGNAVPPSAISKGRDLTEVFQDEVESVADETGCSLVEASQYVRKARPNLFRAMRGD